MHSVKNAKATSSVGIRMIDATGIGLSSLCVIHCLALPVLASMLPVLSSWAEAEWVHKLFVLLAIPISGSAAFIRGVHYRNLAFVFFVTLGLALLTASAFLESLHDIERPLTVAGAMIVAIAHLWRWRRHYKSPKSEN